MYRIVSLCLVIGTLVILKTPERVTGQPSIRKFNPPVVRVELSGVEPVPPGVSAEILYGPGGGGCGNQADFIDDFPCVFP